jgi:DNA repair exonuclease SbcCD ATPase subunit
MIPVGMALEGFLSFRDEQRLEFDQDQVWLLSGPNGSGKSAVFDAILFALYAGHRAGKADLHELINKDATRAVVRFDFLLADRRYRAERVVERTTDRKTGRAGYASTQQLYLQEDGAWQPIAGTHRQSDFSDWIREHIGLSFDAFTSSALLMQGRADVLVAQDAEAARRRFEVLARIVGLDYYERLHKQADDLRKKNEKRAHELQAQLEVIEPIDGAKLDGLAQRATAMAGELTTAEAELEKLHALKSTAARWVELRGQREARQGESDAAAALFSDAVAIEWAGTRLQELQALLPSLQRLVALRADVASAEETASALERQRADVQTAVAAANDASARRLAAIEALQTAQAEDEQQRLKLTGTQQQLQLAQGPLRRLHRHRGQLRQVADAVRAAADKLHDADNEMRHCEEALVPVAEALEEAAWARREAGDAATTAKTRLADFEEQARRFDEVAGARVCRYCGQELSPGHAERERKRLAREKATRQTQWEAAHHALAAAAEAEARCKAEHDAANRLLAQARQRANELHGQRDRAVDQERVQAQAIEDALGELAEPYRGRVSASAYPSADDVATLDREVAGVGGQLDTLRQAASERQNKIGRLRQEHQEAERDRTALHRKLSALEASLLLQQERVKLSRQQLEPARAALPARWQYRADELDDAHIEALAGECRQLTEKDAAAKLERLRQAQKDQEAMRARLAKLDHELEQVPAEARRAPVEFEAALRSAKEHENTLRSGLGQLQAEQRQLKQRHERREKIAREFRAADRQRHLSSRLAQLLSRRHLQRHLLRQAEVGIVDNTNRVLDRLTAGQLYVRLLPEEDNGDNRALQLEAYKREVRQSFGLSFLSGSERFRVAIGLALGIGQYASRQHRAIESVIIDEGFGCLDRDNRRTMIDELDHLRGQLRCILLVSHQEEFADAFPDGYRFRFADGMTRVERAE